MANAGMERRHRQDRNDPHLDVMGRYKKITGSETIIRYPEAVNILVKSPGMQRFEIVDQIRNLIPEISDKSFIHPDVFMFIHDRRMDRKLLEDQFGWSDISIRQVSAVLSSLSLSKEDNFPVLSARLKKEIGHTYPHVIQFLKDKTNVPARFFLHRLQEILPDAEERKQISKAIKQTGTAIKKSGLSPYEYAIIILIAKGMTNAETARFLGNSRQSTKKHQSDLKRKLEMLTVLVGGEKETGGDILNRVQVVIMALKMGLIPARVMEGMPEYKKTRKIAKLSDRELQVLRLAAEGKTNKEIAPLLVISKQTVKNHFTHIYKKLRFGHGHFTRLNAALMYIFYEKKGLPLPQDTIFSGFPPQAIIFNSPPPDIRS